MILSRCAGGETDGQQFFFTRIMPVSVNGTCEKIFLSSSAMSRAIAIFVREIKEICPVDSKRLIEP